MRELHVQFGDAARVVSDYLVDNSAWSRLALGDQAVTARLRQIQRAPSDLFVTCPRRLPTYLLTMASLAAVAGLHLGAHARSAVAR